MRRVLSLLVAVLLVSGSFWFSSGLPVPVAPAPQNQTAPREAPSPAAIASSAHEGAPERAAASAQRSRVVRVVDAGSGQGLAGLRVDCAELTEDQPRWLPAVTDAAGCCTLPLTRADIVVAVHGSHHGPALRLVAADETSELTIALVANATLTLRFVDASGAPVAGVASRLLPPLLAGRDWDANWARDSEISAWGPPWREQSADALRARLAHGIPLPRERAVAPVFDLLRPALAPAASDSSGTITWTVAASAGWRFGIVSPHLAEIEPAHESTPLRPAAEGVQVRAGKRVRTLSGAFALAPGASCEFTVRIAAPAGLSGCFATGSRTLPPQVKLYHVTSIAGPAGRGGAVDLSPEAFTVADAAGGFHFTGVQPGNKVVRAYWNATATDFVFATATAQLMEGQHVDLGTLLANPGSVPIRIELRDRAGRAVPPTQQLVGDASTPTAILHAAGWREPGNLAGSILEAIAVPLGVEVRLHGLASGTMRLRATRGLDWPDVDTLGTRVLDAPGRELTLPCAGPATLVMPVEQRVPRSLVLSAATALTGPIQVWLRPLDGGVPERLQVAAPRTGAPTALAVLAEPYEVFAHEPPDRPGARIGIANLDFRRGGDQVLQLVPGATVRGQCRRTDDRPLAAAKLAWGRAGWSREGQPIWVFRATTDAEGRFALHGLPPMEELLGAKAGTNLQTPAAGGAAEVVMTTSARHH